jgi:hypothetical protein
LLKLYPRLAEKGREALCLPLLDLLHVSRIASLFSDDLDDDPFGALPIEFAVEKALPGTKIDPAIGDGQDDLVMQQEVFEVGIPVVLACLVMAIAGIYGFKLLCPFHDVAVEAGFLVLDDDSCGEVHRGYEGKTFLDSAFMNDAFDFFGDGDDFCAFLVLKVR